MRDDHGEDLLVLTRALSTLAITEDCFDRLFAADPLEAGAVERGTPRPPLTAPSTGQTAPNLVPRQ